MKRDGLRTPCRLWIAWVVGTMLCACAHHPGAIEVATPETSLQQEHPMAAVEIIPRRVLFGNPDRAQGRLSPDGRWLTWLAPRDGVLNVWLAAFDTPDQARPLTDDRGRGIRSHGWAYDNRHVLYVQDQDGDENWRIYAVNIASGESRCLTPQEGIQARIEALSQRHPGAVLVGVNDREPALHDLYRVDIGTGERTLHLENDGFPGFVIDDDFKVRYAIAQTPSGGSQWLRPGNDGWELETEVGMEDDLTTAPLGFDSTGSVFYFLDSRGRNTAGIFERQGTEVRLLGESAQADVSGVLTHPVSGRVQAWESNYLRQQWQVLDPAVAGDFSRLAAAAPGDFHITSRTLADDRWLVVYILADGPAKTFLYHRNEGRLDFLFTNVSALEPYALSPMHPEVIPSRDGLELVSYLTLPSLYGDAARPDAPLPMVLLVHGGPWARDHWGLNPTHQWLANRGYAVLSVNFRGSTGFGKAFINAANMEWAGKMHDDLIDAVAWATAEGIADPDRVCIMGGSYGGYAALVGLTFTPERFACAVDIVGPSNLITLLESVPPYWLPMIEMFTSRVGDHRTAEGRALLQSRSPLFLVDQIQRPLLIGQGANDPRVKQAESDQIVQAMQARSIPVVYALFPDEGHGFARPENRMAFNAVVEFFLAAHLGGRSEPLGSDLEGASMQVLSGADLVDGLTLP